MSLTLDCDALDRLSTEERPELIGILWDAIADSDPNPPIPDWHIEGVPRRRAEAEMNAEADIPFQLGPAFGTKNYEFRTPDS